MKMIWIYSVMAILCHNEMQSSSGQECSSTQELQASLRQAYKLLSAHEASYLQGLRSLRKKLSLLQKAAMMGQPTKPSNASCPLLETPPNGRKLGKALGVGNEVHFLCEPGYELLGTESRVCMESLSWSGQPALCRNVDECVSAPCLNGGTCVDDVNRFICLCPKNWMGPSCQTPTLIFFSTVINGSSPISPSPPPSPFVHPAQCTQLQGSTRCSCEAGFAISGPDNRLCTDVDECTLFHEGQGGRLCLHNCVNTPGGYRCTCPSGYNVTRDSRGCKDVDECADRQHTCTQEQLCVNTYGGFQCVRVECPRIRNATYSQTSATRCERNPCPVDNKGCLKAPNSVSFHFLSVVSNLPAPRVLFRVSATRMLGDTLRFGLLGTRGRQHFTVQRSDRQTGQLMLTRPVEGPATLEAEVEMSELEKGSMLGRYITRVTLFVSQYHF
ncbi:fibulin-7 [Paramormyrops kingsleyae]|uniref:fibulin-7 n=1 Tax=Paramormyrops kingsleyae TaxID=1676925 RepID=UPI000CD66FA3|nr:fibulin-7-like [Paramormyrops kingsleyae]